MKNKPPAASDPGENMNVRAVHAAIWREESEPAEVMRRMLAVLKHFYFLMILWLVLYVAGWFPPLQWEEYEASPMQRKIRDDSRQSGLINTAQP